jgi:hypothetical protein
LKDPDRAIAEADDFEEVDASIHAVEDALGI